MLILSIIGGKAFTFHEYKLGYVQKGKWCDVIRNIIYIVSKDLVLIKPKKFGYKPRS